MHLKIRFWTNFDGNLETNGKHQQVIEKIKNSTSVFIQNLKDYKIKLIETMVMSMIIFEFHRKSIFKTKWL